MRLRLAQPAALVDINGIKELDHIKEDGSKLRIGALTRHVTLQNSQVVKDKLPLLAEVAEQVGDNQVRNMGTIGGVVAHADAAGDYPTIALMLDAEIVTNKRTIAAKDFFTDLFTTPLAGNEIVTEVVFPVADGPHKYIKFRRRLFDWAIVGAAAQKMNGGWRIDRKSTRLNSSHSQISYAVLCLEKKEKHEAVGQELRHPAHAQLRLDYPTQRRRLVPHRHAQAALHTRAAALAPRPAGRGADTAH